MAEFLWQSVWAGFPARPRLTSAGNGVTYLGDSRIPAAVEHVLNKGLKCSFQPRSTRPELLSHVHRVGQRVQEQDQQRAIGDGIDCLMRTVTHSQARIKPPVEVWFLGKGDGEILAAHCSCMAGNGEACSHIAALLCSVLYTLA
ncbi:hypothetical protein HPB52_024376 [Rhipicephalus sanguineus]|uniref:SWIM-type domain-containing protein n=1 Tax=Rhipicephalus sanguineus TaxID=34632 RepID=A0A9D4P9F9_RHISA|nr:hypothetical protein HPB52_024376 [Rhipicephalus sanguineus]